MIEINKNPSSRVLRQFSAAAGVFAALIGFLVFRKTASWPAAGAIWSVGAAIAGAGLAAPRSVRLVYLGLNYIAMPIGVVVSTVVLAGVYYFVVTPVGVAMRLAGRDPLSRRYDPAAETYWLKRKTAAMKRYFRQF